MSRLGIDLQDGFAEDTVIVRVNGRKVYEKDRVSTKLLYGQADSMTCSIRKGSAKVSVAVPTRNLDETFEIAMATDTYLGLSVTEDRIDHIIREEPFGYA